MTKLLKIDLRSPVPGCSDRVSPLLNLFYMVSRMCLTNFMLLRDLSRFLPQLTGLVREILIYFGRTGPNSVALTISCFVLFVFICLFYFVFCQAKRCATHHHNLHAQKCFT